MQRYILDQEYIEELLEGLQTAYSHCKEVQQQYVANIDVQHMDSPEMAMEVIEDLENFAHMLALLGKQWEELCGIQNMVTEHYLYDMISSLEEPTAVESVADEGVEGYDVGVALGVDFVMADRWQGEEVLKEAVETVELKPVSTSFMDLFSNTSETKRINEYDYEDWVFADEDSADPSQAETAIDLTKQTSAESNLYDTFEIEKSKKEHKKRCKHCTENSPIPEEREKCCIVKREKKKKKEKSKDKSKHKKEVPSVDKWAKKLSKWERYAEEHGDAWTEKVLQKVAKKAEKKADKKADKKTEKRGMKAIFKKHKLDRFAKLSKED